MTIYPFTLHIGPLALTGYGIMMMVAFLMAGWAMQLELRRRRLDEEYAADIVIAAVIGGLVGAKIWYVLISGQWGALLSRGGLVWYGGFFGGVAAVLLNGWRKRVPLAFTCELTAPALALGYALGRVGCFLVNDDYGLPSTMPWAMKFPQGLPPSSVGELMRAGATFPAGTDPGMIVAVHPTQLYETAIMLVAFARAGSSVRTSCGRESSGFSWSPCGPRTTGSSGRSRSRKRPAWHWSSSASR